MRRRASHRRPDGERQVGGGACAREVVRRDDRQRRFDASLPGPQDPDRAADAGGGADCAASPVRLHRRRGQFFRRTMGAGGGRIARRRRRRAGYFRRRHGALFPRADRGPVGHPARARVGAGRGPKQVRKVAPRPSFTMSSRRATRRRPRALSRATGSASCARSRLWRRPDVRLSRSSARARRRRSSKANGRVSILRRSGRNSAGASTRGSTPCSRRARSKRSPRSRSGGSIRRCRSCARTAFRISSPISKAGSRSTRPRHARSSTPAITRSGSSPGRATSSRASDGSRRRKR